jgi:glycerate kinase
MTRILLAPDKFKGSLSAVEVAAALARGFSSAAPHLDVRHLPVADGGEGTLEAAVSAGYERVPVVASGPTGEEVQTAYARRGETAGVEMADVSGLARLPEGRQRPRDASSHGTGEVVLAAVRDGCNRVVLGIGGSACTDGGAGLVQALGARLLDSAGQDLAPGGAALAGLATLDLHALEDLRDVEIVVACDVDNPLTGPRGAAAVYGPQKGASAADVVALDRALTHWADLVRSHTGQERRDVNGAGAAGGVGFAAVALLRAELRPGIDLLLDLLDFDEHVRGADWVVVGEGSLDEQSLHGKAPVGVAARARRAGARVLAVSGRSSVTTTQLHAVGIEAVHTLMDLAPDPETCMREAARLLEATAQRLSRAGYFAS